MMLDNYYKEHLRSPQARRFANTLARLARAGPQEVYPLGIANDPEHALDDALAAVQAVRCDDPRIFWLGCPWHAEANQRFDGWHVEVRTNCPYPANRCYSLLRSALKTADQVLSRIRAEASTQLEAERLLFDTIYRIPYVLDDQPQRHDLLGVFLDRAAVCEGKSLAFCYLARRLGIPCMVVYGKARGEDHTWTILHLDGQFHFLDCTWGWNYFNLSPSQMHRTHTPDPLFPLPDGLPLPLPQVRLHN